MLFQSSKSLNADAFFQAWFSFYLFKLNLIICFELFFINLKFKVHRTIVLFYKIFFNWNWFDSYANDNFIQLKMVSNQFYWFFIDFLEFFKSKLFKCKKKSDHSFVNCQNSSGKWHTLFKYLKIVLFHQICQSIMDLTHLHGDALKL